MTTQKFDTAAMRERLKSDEYAFLREKAILSDNIILLTMGGSISYGTNTPTSDTDIRGIAAEQASALLGLAELEENGAFDTYSDENTDTVIYSLRRITDLLLSCNPNTIEMLGCNPEHYLYLSPAGQLLLDNKKLFLSKRATHTFTGYATAQLRRLTNALARDAYSQSEKEKHILETIPAALYSFNESHTKLGDGDMRLYLAPSKREGYEQEIVMDASLCAYPLRDWSALLGDLNSIIRSFEKLTKRNHKKDELHLNKHAMHLVRLYQTGLDILEKEDIITYRGGEDHTLLMSIRNGDFMKPDGTYSQDFFDLLNNYDSRFKRAAAETSLPELPDTKKVNELLTEINRQIVINSKV